MSNHFNSCQTRWRNWNNISTYSILLRSLYPIKSSVSLQEPLLSGCNEWDITGRNSKKGVYKDGHERPDVVQYRQDIFLKKLKELESRMPYPIRNEIGDVIDIKLPSLSPSSNQVHCIPVTHDECTCNTNDGPHHQWIKGDDYPICKKSRGQGLHISEFITPWGRLCISLDQVSDAELLRLGFHKREATEILQCGGEIWWDQEHIVQ